MKTLLLHGDNITASRARLTGLRESGPVVELAVTDQPPQVTSLFSGESTVVIWSDKKLSATQIKDLEKKFPDLAAEEFKPDPVVFKFLDALKPGNQRVFLPLWQKYIMVEEPEVAFIMVVRQFRLMLNPHDPDLASWQKAKLASQAKSFGQPKLEQIYKQLLEIDYQTKSGRTVVDLKTSLELLLLRL
ncbi:hypothetical protein HY440_03395 [Candidatus Microgenomates bacterium]|nr:hypothetical protein [Candidatus Microgenomates bacterium]